MKSSELAKKRHRAVKAFFKKVERSTGPAQRRRILDHLAQHLQRAPSAA